jgi:hypothetical protein
MGQMNSGFGGVQPTMRRSTILHTDGYLGPYGSILSFGMDRQSTSFLPTDIKPFWMTANAQNERRLAQTRADAAVAPKKPGNNMNNDLAAKLIVLPVHVLDPNKKFKLEKLQGMTSAQQILLQMIIPNIETGWIIGKQKGLLQVSWECGWIDVSCLEEYAIIKKDDAGAVVKELSLQCMIESCLDCTNELTELQSVRGEKWG